LTFLRLSRWDWVAFVAALGLLLVMSADWYTTKQGQECRRIEQLQPPASGVQGGAISGDVRRAARECAEKREKNAWQASGAIDRFILVVLLVGIASAVAAGFFRAAGRRYEPPLTPSAVAAGAGLLGALLVLYRILQPPGLNSAAVVKWGAPAGLALVGIMGIAARAASVVEREAPVEDAEEEAQPEAEPEGEGDAQPEAEAEPEGAGKGEAEPAAEPEPEVAGTEEKEEPAAETEELLAEAEPPVEPEPEADAEPPAEPEPEADAIPEAEPPAEPEPDPDDEPDSSPGGFATGSAPA
jgi:hypothetical protein